MTSLKGQPNRSFAYQNRSSRPVPRRRVSDDGIISDALRSLTEIAPSTMRRSEPNTRSSMFTSNASAPTQSLQDHDLFIADILGEAVRIGNETTQLLQELGISMEEDPMP